MRTSALPDRMTIGVSTISAIRGAMRSEGRGCRPKSVSSCGATSRTRAGNSIRAGAKCAASVDGLSNLHVRQRPPNEARLHCLLNSPICLNSFLKRKGATRREADCAKSCRVRNQLVSTRARTSSPSLSVISRSIFSKELQRLKAPTKTAVMRTIRMTDIVDSK